MTNDIKIEFSTGIPPLDKLLQGLMPGDNVVFKVDDLEDFIPFVHRFAIQAQNDKKKLVYFRFAQHDQLIPENVNAEVIHLNPKKGFENFISEIVDTIDDIGEGCYVFDLLTDLTVSWYSDVMVANFFKLICPYLYKLPTIGYFTLLRNRHEENTIRDIQETAQLIFEIYKLDDHTREFLYIHPLKVFNRFTPNLYALHKWIRNSGESDQLQCIVESSFISKILAESYHPFSERVKQRGNWHLTFKLAEEVVEKLLDKDSPIKVSASQAESLKNELLKMIMVKGHLLFVLAVNYFNLNDLVYKIGNRLIGTGSIGGKAIGMLIARNILKRYRKWRDLLEEVDSFYIGTEVFYTYLIRNDCWWLRRQLCNTATFLDGQDKARERILRGNFSKQILEEFDRLLEYFGQSPIIVRSSSLLEDAYGNSFSGKYESIILSNQGTPEERKQKFVDAIRKVYASTVSTDALTYRKERNLLDQDEAMAVLVQRLSGSEYGNYYFPQAAGVGYSFNPYVWDPKIDPKSGILRLVMGLGTRAVNRTDDDYTRITPLNQPELRPEHNFDQIRTHSQKKIDVVNLKTDKFTTVHFEKKNIDLTNFPIELYAEKDPLVENLGFELDDDKKPFPWVLTFTELLKTNFPKDMKEMLKILEDAYQTPVDIEFTVNFVDKSKYFINLLQCRPLHIEQEILDIDPPKKGIPEDHILFRTSGPILGASQAVDIDYIIFVVPRVYGKLSMSEKYEIARMIGKINNKLPTEDKKVMLIGPGRWGTSSPSLGIPVNFAEVSGVSVIGEIAEMHEGLVPDISLGTHFFNNIVELEVLYFAIQKLDEEDNLLNHEFFDKTPNFLHQFLPDEEKWEHAIKIIDINQLKSVRKIKIHMNSFSQYGLCYYK
ncbi:MAG: pyruvate, phosphate dikinase [Candidatus Lokiarchaeota archaeon]|nr:pyruvate, phosphate dikinase [Candidatus Lokiarchaeota archaeon]